MLELQYDLMRTCPDYYAPFYLQHLYFWPYFRLNMDCDSLTLVLNRHDDFKSLKTLWFSVLIHFITLLYFSMIFFFQNIDTLDSSFSANSISPTWESAGFFGVVVMPILGSMSNPSTPLFQFCEIINCLSLATQPFEWILIRSVPNILIE